MLLHSLHLHATRNASKLGVCRSQCGDRSSIALEHHCRAELTGRDLTIGIRECYGFAHAELQAVRCQFLWESAFGAGAFERQSAHGLPSVRLSDSLTLSTSGSDHVFAEAIVELLLPVTRSSLRTHTRTMRPTQHGFRGGRPKQLFRSLHTCGVLSRACME